MAIDISADLELAPDDNAVRKISSLAQAQLELEAEVAELEFKLSNTQKELARIQERELPDAMMAAGIEELKLSNGAKLYIDEGMSISVGKERKPFVCDWLIENKHDDIIKHEVTVALPKGTDPKLIARLEAGLKKLGVSFTNEQDVNSSTLKALLKEQRQKGAAIELSRFGAYEYKKAVIKLPKDKPNKEKSF